MAKPEVTIPDAAPPADMVVDDIVVGAGAEATAGSDVEVHYVGVAWSNGRQFDASWDRGDTFNFRLGAGQVIEGWDRGVQGMRVGGQRRLTLPPVIAYGSRGAGGVIGPTRRSCSSSTSSASADHRRSRSAHRACRYAGTARTRRRTLSVTTGRGRLVARGGRDA